MTDGAGRRAALAVLLVSAVVAAGCVTGGDAVGEGHGDSGPLFDETTGALEGVVLAEDLRPIEGAVVSIQEGERTNTTGPDGRFVFGLLEPGPHRVVAQAIGYHGFARTVDVVAGQAVSTQLVLPAAPTLSAYHETFPFDGYESCQWYTVGALSTCTLPYAQAYGVAKENGVNLSDYGLPEDPLPSQDKYNFTMHANHSKVVSELFWEATSAGATHQALIIACGWWDPVLDECVPPGETTTGVRYFGKVGTSPIRMEWEHPEPDHLPWVMSRANVNGNVSELKPAGIAVDQKITMYNTVFYGADPPPGFSAGPTDQ